MSNKSENLLQTTNHKLQTVGGVVTIPLILVISGIAMEIAIVGVVVATILGDTAFNERLSVEALSAARAGAYDATMKVLRSRPSCCPSSYNLSVGTRDTDISISSEVGGEVIITSTGKALTRRKRIEVKLGVDNSTGEIKLTSFKEIAI